MLKCIVELVILVVKKIPWKLLEKQRSPAYMNNLWYNKVMCKNDNVIFKGICFVETQMAT